MSKQPNIEIENLARAKRARRELRNIRELRLRQRAKFNSLARLGRDPLNFMPEIAKATGWSWFA